MYNAYVLKGYMLEYIFSLLSLIYKAYKLKFLKYIRATVEVMKN